MHFWIDKRSQGCGFSGRHLVPPSISGYGRNQRLLCGSFHPKPMVTPVHRFQSIESVANNGLGVRHHARSPGYHSRIPANNSFQQCSVHHNPSNSNVRSPQNVGRSSEMVTIEGQSQTPTPRRNSAPKTTKLKWGVYFAVITFFLAYAKYYFHGINNGLEALAFCSVLVIIISVGLVSLYETITTAATTLQAEAIVTPHHLIEQSEEDIQSSSNHSHHRHPSQLHQPHQQQSNQVPTSQTAELPPPPYHIAIMLPSQNDISSTTMEAVQVIRDSPPPSYEKAVT